MSRSTAEAIPAGLRADILSAVAAARAELESLLCTLVQFGSLTGEEAPAQDFMEGLFRGMGLSVARFAVDDTELAALPGY